MNNGRTHEVGALAAPAHMNAPDFHPQGWDNLRDISIESSAVMDPSSLIFLVVISAAFLYPLFSVLLGVVAGRAILRGKRLEKQGQIAEAICAYLIGTRWMVFYHAPQNATNYAHVAKLHFQLQEWDQAYKWANRSLRSKPKASVELSARYTAAFTAYELDEREHAITHFERLAVLAKAEHQDRLANYAYRCSAIVHLDLGRLDESIAGCARMQDDPEYAWVSIMHRVKCLCLQGHLVPAWDLVQALDSNSIEDVQIQQNRHHHVAAWKISICIARKNLDLAWALFQEQVKRREDQYFLLWRAVTEPLLLVLQEEQKPAAQKIDHALQLLSDYQHRPAIEPEATIWPPSPGVPPNKEKREVLRAGYATLAYALFHLGDYTQSQHLWRQSLTFNTAPVRLPETYYSLGECERAQGNLLSAVEWYHAAVKQNIATYHATLARERLEQMLAVRMGS